MPTVGWMLQDGWDVGPGKMEAALTCFDWAIMGLQRGLNELDAISLDIEGDVAALCMGQTWSDAGLIQAGCEVVRGTMATMILKRAIIAGLCCHVASCVSLLQGSLHDTPVLLNSTSRHMHVPQPTPCATP